MVDANIISIILACLAIALTSVVFFLFTSKKNVTSKKSKEPALFISGPSNSGKTALFTLVC